MCICDIYKGIFYLHFLFFNLLQEMKVAKTCISYVRVIHNGNQELCQVPTTLSKALYTHGKCFAECVILGIDFFGKAFFAECFFVAECQKILGKLYFLKTKKKASEK